MASEGLDACVRTSLSLLGGLPEDWIPPHEGVDHDVLIVGAGQNGITAAFALLRQGIRACVIEAEVQGREGVWLTRARMPTLRTPKDKPGPELGIPALTFQTWCTETYGAEAYARIDRIPREIWAEYLAWYRQVLGIDVQYETKFVSIEPAGENLRVTLECAGKPKVEIVRKLVLANGFGGIGAPNVPDVISNSVPRHMYFHTDEMIDFSKFKEKTLGIIGGSASGFDAAAVALEGGAASVCLFCRAPDLARGTRVRHADFPGVDYFHLLPDLDRWRIARLFLERGNHPPSSSIGRAAKYPNFKLHLGSPLTSAKVTGDRSVIGTPKGEFAFDYLIAATGFKHDPTLRPELAPISDQIALWSDRFTPPAGEEDEVLARYPYLGYGFEFLEKVDGKAPFLKNIHVVNVAALPCFLRVVGDIKCLGFTSQRLASSIVRDLFFADKTTHLARLRAPILVELTGEEYRGCLYEEPACAVTA